VLGIGFRRVTGEFTGGGEGRFRYWIDYHVRAGLSFFYMIVFVNFCYTELRILARLTARLTQRGSYLHVI